MIIGTETTCWPLVIFPVTSGALGERRRKRERRWSGGGLSVGQSGREGGFHIRPLTCRVDGFGLSVCSKGGGRGAR